MHTRSSGRFHVSPATGSRPLNRDEGPSLRKRAADFTGRTDRRGSYMRLRFV